MWLSSLIQGTCASLRFVVSSFNISGLQSADGHCAVLVSLGLLRAIRDIVSIPSEYEVRGSTCHAIQGAVGYLSSEEDLAVL